MKQVKNNVILEGYLYSHELEKKITGAGSRHPGTEYIRGKIDIATNEACDNIVSVYYTYVTAVTSKGKANATYTTLLNILEGRYKTVMSSSKEEAYKLRVNTSIGLNEFYSNRNGNWELVSVKRNMGGFIHNVTMPMIDREDRNKFEVDMVITNCTRKEGDSEKNIPEKVTIKGAIFDSFRKTLYPVEFSAISEDAMNYFEDLGASSREPVFTLIKGHEISTTIVRKFEEEGAFGGSYVREVPTTRRDYVVTWAAKEPYVWDDETTLTADEMRQMMADRETYLATLKQDAIQRQSAKIIPIVKSTTTATNGGYDF